MDLAAQVVDALAFTVPWAAVAALLGVASVFASSWLTNKREEREEDSKRRNYKRIKEFCSDLLRRVDALEEEVEKLQAAAPDAQA